MQKICPRIKGYVNSTDGNVYMIQSVFNAFESKLVEGYTGPSELVAFGEGLTPRILRDTFVMYAG